jgi:nitrogen fixation protein FixH
MAYIQRRNKFRQITGNLIVYSISVFLGTVALVFFYNSWNSAAGHLIIFMSPYLIYIAVSYGLRHRKSKSTTEKKEKLATDLHG